MSKGSIFSSDMTMISFFNIVINQIIFLYPTFSRVFKVFIIFFSRHKFFVKFFRRHISAIFTFFDHTVKDVLSDLRPLYAAKSPLKTMKMLSISRLLSFFVLKIFCPEFLVNQQNGLIRKIKLISNFYDVTTLLINDCNTHIAQYLEK